MERLELSAEKRAITGKEVKYLRRQGLVPAIVFGHAIESMPIQIHEKELRMVLSAAGTNRLISLKIEGVEQPTLALAREIQRDVLTAALWHVDFQAVVMTEKIRTSVGLTFVNTSPAVAEGTGMLLQSMDEVEIECLPADLITSIQVDLSVLAKIDDTIHVKDLQVPPTVKVLTSSDDTIVRVTHVTEIPVEEEEVAEEAAPAEVEVIRKGKVAEEGVEGA